MSNIIPLNDTLPAHIRARFADVSANDTLSSGLLGGFPVISYKGKVWALTTGGVREVLVNAEGDPRASIEVVLLKANAALSKTYYKDGYEEGSSEQPDCYSDDGVAPMADARFPQSKTCAVCPHNQWGSKISDQGKKGKECADVRRLAVAAADALEQPTLLRIPAGSLRELQVYGDNLKKRGVPFQALVTKVKFDPDVAFPRMLFSAARWLDEAELDAALETAESSLTDRIIGIDGATGHASDIADQDDVLDKPPAHVQAVGNKATAAAPKATAAPKTTARRAPKESLLPTQEDVAKAVEGTAQAANAAAPAPAAKPPADVSAAALLADADSALANLLGGMMSDD